MLYVDNASQFRLATFQVLSNNKRLVATVLNHAGLKGSNSLSDKIG